MTTPSPLPKGRLTNRETIETIREMHECMERRFDSIDHRQDQLAKEISDVRHSSANTAMAVHQLGIEAAEIRGAQKMIGRSLGVEGPRQDGEPKARMPVGALSTTKAVLALLGSAGAAAGAYKYLFPLAEATLTAAHHALMGG